jgi:hypothetical protein
MADRASAEFPLPPGNPDAGPVLLRRIDDFSRKDPRAIALASEAVDRREGQEPTAPRHPPVVLAVFDIQDASGRFPPRSVVQLTEYLSARLAESGSFRVIPREQLRQRLVKEKTGSYRECFEQTCQIELGKAIAAEKTLATKILHVGDYCAMTATLLDLRSETAEKGASVRTTCTENALMDGMDQIVGQLGLSGR